MLGKEKTIFFFPPHPPLCFTLILRVQRESFSFFFFLRGGEGKLKCVRGLVFAPVDKLPESASDGVQMEKATLNTSPPLSLGG